MGIAGCQAAVQANTLVQVPLVGRKQLTASLVHQPVCVGNACLKVPLIGRKQLTASLAHQPLGQSMCGDGQERDSHRVMSHLRFATADGVASIVLVSIIITVIVVTIMGLPHCGVEAGCEHTLPVV